MPKKNILITPIIILTIIVLVIFAVWFHIRHRQYSHERWPCRKLADVLEQFCYDHSRMPNSWDELENLGYGKQVKLRGEKCFLADKEKVSNSGEVPIPVDMFSIRWGVSRKDLPAIDKFKEALFSKVGKSYVGQRYYIALSSHMFLAMNKYADIKPSEMGDNNTSTQPSK